MGNGVFIRAQGQQAMEEQGLTLVHALREGYFQVFADSPREEFIDLPMPRDRRSFSG